MNFIRIFLLVFVSFTSFLWAKTSYYILPVQFEGVHEDYAKTIFHLTKEYIENEGDEIVSNKSDCDFLLRIKLILKEKGVAVVFEKMNDSGEILWSYGHIAYSPERFVPIVKRVVRKMNAWENEFICGFGFGAMGLISLNRFVDYNYEPFIQFNVESFKLAMDLDIAYLGSKPKGVRGSMMGISFSVAYMFGRRFVVPYLGAGMNYAIFSTEIEKEVEKMYGVKVKESFSETGHTPGYFLEMGLSMKMKNEIHIMLESRYFRELYKQKDILDGSKSIVHGFSVMVKFGV